MDSLAESTAIFPNYSNFERRKNMHATTLQRLIHAIRPWMRRIAAGWVVAQLTLCAGWVVLALRTWGAVDIVEDPTLVRGAATAITARRAPAMFKPMASVVVSRPISGRTQARAAIFSVDGGGVAILWDTPIDPPKNAASARQQIEGLLRRRGFDIPYIAVNKSKGALLGARDPASPFRIEWAENPQTRQAYALVFGALPDATPPAYFAARVPLGSFRKRGEKRLLGWLR